MTKAEIIDSVYERVGGFSKKEAAEIVEAVFDAMKDVLAEGEKIKISGFGNFVVRAKKRRTGRNPQTGEPISISARRVLTFKASQVLKNVLNPSTSAAASSASASGTSASGASGSASAPSSGIAPPPSVGAPNHGVGLSGTGSALPGAGGASRTVPGGGHESGSS